MSTSRDGSTEGALGDSRMAAASAKWAFFEANAEAFDSIFNMLVKTRHGIAKKLGFKKKKNKCQFYETYER